jgi:hypothetical protein
MVVGVLPGRRAGVGRARIGRSGVGSFGLRSLGLVGTAPGVLVLGGRTGRLVGRDRVRAAPCEGDSGRQGQDGESDQQATEAALQGTHDGRDLLDGSDVLRPDAV